MSKTWLLGKPHEAVVQGVRILRFSNFGVPHSKDYLQQFTDRPLYRPDYLGVYGDGSQGQLVMDDEPTGS